MVKISFVLLQMAVIKTASAFVPVLPACTFKPSKTSLLLSEEAQEPQEGGKLVPINDSTVEFTAGLVGGLAGLTIGGPIVGALSATAANYLSKTDMEAGEIVAGISKTAIELYNYLARLDSKYALLDKTQRNLESVLTELKENPSVDQSTIEKVESALSTTKDKIVEVNDQYDLVGTLTTSLGVVGDLIEKALLRAGELNDEYGLTDKAQDALKSAVDKAKEKIPA